MKNKNVRLGIFFSGGLIILIATLFVVGSKQNLFESNITLRSYFTDAMGLREGSSVRYVGITVGSVNDVSIVNDTAISVTMTINKNKARYITKDAQAVINSDGLMGNKLVTILPGTPDAGPVEDLDEIPSKKPIGIDNVMNSVLENSKNLEELTENLVAMSSKINSGRGLVGKLLFDTIIERRFSNTLLHIDQVVGILESATDNINQMTEKTANGEGSLGKLINDDAVAIGITNIIDSLSVASTNLSSATDEINTFTEKLNDGRGPLSKLVYDTAMADNLNQTIINAKDRTAELEETIELVNDSWILNLFSGKNKKDRNKSKKM
jgi:phospholipid/cholesterol/gamma-HCH transport system substrate-binding protein